MNMIYIWKGKDLEECTKEELIEAIKTVKNELETERQRHATTLTILNSTGLSNSVFVNEVSTHDKS